MDQEQILKQLLTEAITCRTDELEGKIKEYVLKMKDISSREELLQGTLRGALNKIVLVLEDKLNSKPIVTQQEEEQIDKTVAETDRIGNVKPQANVLERLVLQQKIKICREALLRAKYQTASEKMKNVKLDNFSWGIIITEPKTLAEFDTDKPYFRKIRGDAPVMLLEKMRFTDCGQIQWCNHSGLSISDISANERKMQVPGKTTPEGKTILDAQEVATAYNSLKVQTGDLRLIKVSVQGEKSFDYMIVLGIKNPDKVKPESLQSFLCEVYTSKPHREALLRSLKSGECPYGGTIVEGDDGKLELRFYESAIEAVSKANRITGSYISEKEKSMPAYMQNKKRGKLTEISHQISGEIAAIEAINGLEKQQQLGIEH